MGTSLHGHLLRIIKPIHSLLTVLVTINPPGRQSPQSIVVLHHSLSLPFYTSLFNGHASLSCPASITHTCSDNDLALIHLSPATRSTVAFANARPH